jgi:hypothetical protein
VEKELLYYPLKYMDMFLLFSDYINTVNLPTRSQASLTFEGQAVIASGWGKTSESKHVEPLNS